MTAARYGVPTASTSARVARTLLALHVAGESGILAPDLIERVQTSKATLYRVLTVIRAAGWRIESEPEMVDGLRFARLRISSRQQLPRQIKRVPKLR